MSLIGQGRRGGVLDEGGGSGIDVRLYLSKYSHQLRIAHDPADAIAGHGRALGKGVEDQHPLPLEVQDRNRGCAEVDFRVRFIRADDDIVGAGKLESLPVESFIRGHPGGGVRIVEPHQFGLPGDFGGNLGKIYEKIIFLSNQNLVGQAFLIFWAPVRLRMIR